MKKLLKDNGLSIALLVMFLLTVTGQYVTGWHVYSEGEMQHGRVPVNLLGYVAEGHFLEALFENWESEFLQMAVYVVFTIFLFQKGSSESKDPERQEPVDADPRLTRRPRVPWPVRRRGLVLVLYEHSLSTALFLLFGASFLAHAVG